MPDANFPAAFAILLIASVSFFGIGMMTAVLPLISPEKGAQLGFVAQGMLLVVSGVYYPVSVLPDWMQWISKISPATYALRGIRGSILEGQGLLWANVWPLLVIGVSRSRSAWRVQARRGLREAAREAEALGLGGRSPSAPGSEPGADARQQPGVGGRRHDLSAICDISRLDRALALTTRWPYLHQCTEHGAPEVEGLPSD